MLFTENDTIITRAAVESNPKIRLVDSDDSNNIQLFCYDTCSTDDDDIVKASRGIVFSGDTLVMKAFPFTVDYTEKDNAQEIHDLLHNNICSIFDSFEGSLLRMFFFNNKWYLSTNRKLDAYKSRWASKTSFGELFNQALQYEFITNETFRKNLDGENSEESISDIMCKFLNRLDTGKQYMFLLLNTFENRIVCQYDHPKFLHVGTFIDGNLTLQHDDDLGLDYPKQHLFETIHEMFHYVNTLNVNLLQGLIIFGPNNKQYKILNQTYLDLYNIRGNESSVKFRYLQVRNDVTMNHALRRLYPEWCPTFDAYDHCIIEICNNILQAYINRYIRKMFVTLPLEQFIIMSEVHKWHVLDREKNKINFSIVQKTMNLQKPTSMNQMIKKFMLEKKKSVLI